MAVYRHVLSTRVRSARTAYRARFALRAECAAAADMSMDTVQEPCLTGPLLPQLGQLTALTKLDLYTQHLQVGMGLAGDEPMHYWGIYVDRAALLDPCNTHADAGSAVHNWMGGGANIVLGYWRPKRAVLVIGCSSHETGGLFAVAPAVSA